MTNVRFYVVIQENIDSYSAVRATINRPALRSDQVALRFSVELPNNLDDLCIPMYTFNADDSTIITPDIVDMVKVLSVDDLQVLADTVRKEMDKVCEAP